MEICKMLTISTIHISRETSNMLDEDLLPVTEFKKGNYGWFIFCPENLIVFYNNGKDIPDDLWKCMLFACEKSCSWLCLDCDGNEVAELPVYIW